MNHENNKDGGSYNLSAQLLNYDQEYKNYYG